jgi:transcriptional regulator with XRE-family HTH domain
MTRKIELTQQFRYMVEKTGMTHSAVAKGMGVTRQFFSAVWNGKEEPTTRFIKSAIDAGLGKTFNDVVKYQADESEALSA